MGKIKGLWFESSPAWAQLVNFDKESSVHHFWDGQVEADINSLLVSYVIETPQGSPWHYKIDLSSGQHYAYRPFCPLKDTWNEFKDQVERPNFSIGFIPRVFDQLMTPQKIIVFGDEQEVTQFYIGHEFQAYIVGAVIEKYCPYRECRLPEQWLSRLVLVGVDANNSKWQNIRSLEQLKKKIDWNYAKAFLGNSQGQRYSSKNDKGQKTVVPAFKIQGEIQASDAFQFLKDNSLFFSLEKMKSLKFNCLKLYENLFQTIEINGSNKDQLFYERFKNFMSAYSGEFATCQRLVYSANINFDYHRFRLLKFVEAFNYLLDLGYRYDCNRQSWVSNPWQTSSKSQRKTKKQLEDQLENKIDKKRELEGEALFRFCTNDSLDRSFDLAILKFQALKNEELPHYRFIEYDKGLYGTHRKLDSWVYEDGTQLNCMQADKFRNESKIFPTPLRWRRNLQDIKEELIIR